MTKILATDYDGTLKYAQNVMQEDLDAIKKWKEAGNLFVIVTGRSMESIKAQADLYQIPVDYYVTNNGGMVFDADGNKLFSSYLDTVTSIDLLYIAKEIEGVVSYVVNDGYNRHRIVVNKDLQERRYLTLEPDLTEEQVMDLGRYAQVVISMVETGLAVSLAEQINSNFDDIVQAYANQFVVDIVPKGTSKATGLDFVCEFSEVDEMDVYTIGDSYNDIPLMEFGINGACMSTALEDVKEHALKEYDSIHDMITDILK
ncbi:HAD-IIB family hydrolase [Floccifex sp.]|uniref:HAD-IIB family hydrolase n=1 Tax=Floccifex sp. TaxID=2815810 RepID=UPI003F06FBCF